MGARCKMLQSKGITTWAKGKIVEEKETHK